MRSLVFASLLAILSLKVYSADFPDPQEKQKVIILSHGLSVQKAVDILNTVSDGKITWTETLCFTCASFLPGAILETLGALGYKYTCDNGGSDAAKLLCHFSIASLSLGSLCLAVGLATPLVILVINYR